MASHVFLSYSSLDAYQIDRIAQSLEAVGLSLWRDREDLRLGERYWQTIGDQIKNAGCLVVLVSTNSLNNDNVKREVEIALKEGVPVIPLLRSIKPDQLDEWWAAAIGHLHAITFGNVVPKTIKAIVQPRPVPTRTEHVKSLQFSI
jgi:hypothetical protein